MAARPMDPSIKELPLDVQAALVQDYTDLQIHIQCANAFVVQGTRKDSGVLEHIEGVSLERPSIACKLRKTFENCSSDPACPIRAIDSTVFGNHHYFRYSGHGESLYRKFVHKRPYIGGEDGIDMLIQHLPPVIHRERAEVLEILQVGTKLCREIQKLHNNQIVHNGINPHISYLVSGEVILYTFGLTDIGSDESDAEDLTVSPINDNLVMYLSPESTGRTNTQPDYRSDIYALGCTLYELLVGRPPFVAPDMLSYIHRHLTMKPINIHSLTHSIPSQLGSILLKCLEKSPDSRYSSVSGIIYDLETLHQLIAENGDLRTFQVGSLDDLLRFNVSRLLCGRENESRILSDALQSTLTTKQTSVVSIAGELGIGKSQLVAGLILEKNTTFVAVSKYMQYRRGATYHALTSAIQTLARQILTQSHRDIKSWRAKLHSNASLAAVIADTVPEFKILLGQESVAGGKMTNAGAYEVRKKFHAAFIYVLSVFAEAQGLILCQDDVQWANQAELDLLIDIATQVPRLMLILARRPVDGDDAVEFALDVVRTHDIKVDSIILSNLREEDVATIVTRTLHNQRSSELDSLSHFIFEKTSGNPSLVTQFLSNLHKSNKVYFRVSEMRWRFNIKAIKDEELTDDIIDIITVQMRELSPSVRTMIATAAALDQERFSPTSLSKALDRDLTEVAAQFDVAVDRNIFRSLTASDVPALTDSEPSQEMYSFLHSRTQESAYKLLTAEEAVKVHHKIATNLFMGTDFREGDNGSEVITFVLANQYNKCLELLDHAQGRDATECNIAAGQLALKIGDIAAALNYMRIAESISEKSQLAWSVRARIRFGLMQALQSNGAYEEHLSVIGRTLPDCSTLRDQTRCYIGSMQALIALGRLAEANETGFTALRNLDFQLPADDEAADRLTESLASNFDWESDFIDRLYDQPYLSDENLLLVQEVLTILVLPIYMARPRFLGALCYASFSITSTKGPSLEGAYPAMMLGAYLSSVSGRNNLIASRACGNYALNILEKAGDDLTIAPGMYHLYAGHIAVFHRPMVEVVQFEDLAISTGKAVFNVEYTVFSLVEKPVFLTWSGRDLVQTAKDLSGSKSYVMSTKSTASACFLAVHWYGVSVLAGLNSDSTEICPFLEAEDVGLAIETGLSKTHAFMWELWQLTHCILNRNIASLRISIRRCCIEYMEGVLGTYYAALASYLAAVALLTMQWMKIDLTSEEQELIRGTMAAMRQYAEFAPTTFMSKCKFLEALFYRSTGHDHLKLLDLYDEAIEEAAKHEVLGELALILESTGRWLERVSPARSKQYLQRSYDTYRAWNCVYKVQLLEGEYSWLIKPSVTDGTTQRPSLRDLKYNTSQGTINGTNHPDIIESAKLQSETSINHLRSRSIQNHVDSYSSLATTNTRSETAPKLQSNPSARSIGHASVGDSNTLSDLDIKTVLNASIQISQGMKAEDVFESLMKTVLLAAGADYGVLALHGVDSTANSPLAIHTLADGDSITLMRATPAFERPDLLPLSIVKSVVATQKPIIRHDSHDYLFDSSFARDRYYLSRNKPLRSVLCMPIPANNGTAARGVLYLENNATASAFTNQRLECLTLLCTQSAMTLDRAGIYQEMKAARTQAEEATAQKSTFLANMSHEIRTPFNALLSCAIFLLDTTLTDVQKEYVQTIRDSATLTLSIIDGILDFSKVEQGMMDIVLAPFSLSDTIETAMQVVAQKASSAGIDLVYSRKHKPDTVVGDSLHLRQAVLNLLGNAVKFTSQGYVKITSSFKAHTDDKHRMLSIIVQDTGIGISASGIERLFKAFSQVDASINRSYGGTGLGLAISKKLIELMGGNIWLESKEGEGSTFFIELPVEIDANHQNKDDSMTIKQTDRIKKEGRLALVISRYHSTADVLMDDLSEIGLTVHKNTEVLNPDSIAEAARERPYSLLFVDLQVDGALDLVKSLQKILPSAESHFKIIILTNYGINVPQDISSARIAGYLVKPIQKNKLLDAVASALKKIGQDGDAVKGSQETDAEKATQSKKIAQSDQGPIRILLAEDNIINTKVALQHLKRLGYTDVTHAKDGIEVLEHCAKAVAASQMFDLILMDVQMPRLDGIGATEELVIRYPDAAQRPPIVALTANATSTDKERCSAAGMTSHLSKPILPDDLLRCLKSIKRRPPPSSSSNSSDEHNTDHSSS